MLDDWLRALVETPGLTAIGDVAEARRVLLEDSLRGAGVVSQFDGPIVDVGSGGGVPGIPLAAALPDREVMTIIAPDGSSVPGFETPLPHDEPVASDDDYGRDPLPIQ